MAATELNWQDFSPDEVRELLDRGRTEAGTNMCSGFLDVHQYYPLLGQPGYSVWGGHPEAQFRRVAVGTALPPVTPWQIDSSALPPNLRSSRQLRRWLNDSGGRQNVGDIIVSTQALIYANADFLLGRLLPAAIATSQFETPLEPRQRVTAASPRIDAVVATIFHVARSEALTAIEFGFVFQNCALAAKPSRSVSPGDNIVYRTKGRCKLFEMRKNERSGRVIIEYALYPA